MFLMSRQFSFSVKRSRLARGWPRLREELLLWGVTLAAVAILYSILFVIEALFY